LRIRLDGHTDVTGAAQFNFDLGERRAHAVAGFLRDGGVSGDRLEVRSFGPTRPIASNDTPEGRRRNRRVEISVIDF
jgi:outer membrane protein OmpA-like peptidoglycan-associated protein